MVKFSTTELTWYEDGNLAEHYPDGTLKNRVVVECTLKQAVKYAQDNSLCLVIQPAFQDECIFIDYTEE